MLDVQRHSLGPTGAEAIWATPLSGYGLIADEQPLPYIHRRSRPLTPRFGGEETNPACAVRSLPLPYGKLAQSWPFSQRLFNLPRRRVNIYWREMVRSRTRPDGMFFLHEQMQFTPHKMGFSGRCPCFSFTREFELSESDVIVRDRLMARHRLQFSYLILCPWAGFGDSQDSPECEITPSLISNVSYPILSSTGPARFFGHRIEDVTLEKGALRDWQLRYRLT